jgi:hypothetical protein
MKSRIFILSLIMVVSLTILTSGGTKKEISVDEAIKAFSYTWVNPDYSRDMGRKIVVHPDGIISIYGLVELSLDTPHREERYTIDEAWTDRDGNIWFKTTHTQQEGITYQINRISESGTVWEYHWSFSDLPDEINPDAPKYRIRYRQ